MSAEILSIVLPKTKTGPRGISSNKLEKPQPNFEPPTQCNKIEIPLNQTQQIHTKFTNKNPNHHTPSYIKRVHEALAPFGTRPSVQRPLRRG